MKPRHYWGLLDRSTSSGWSWTWSKCNRSAKLFKQYFLVKRSCYYVHIDGSMQEKNNKSNFI